MGGWFTKIVIIILVLITLSSISLLTLQNQNQIPFSWNTAIERSSPSDWIQEDQITVYEKRVILDIPNTTWATFTNTNSMDPFIDETSHAIEILPTSADQINVGDVISYQTNIGIVIHRVIEKNVDKNGIYFTVKGDNNNYPDTQKVYFDQIVGVVVAVIY